MGVSKNSGTPKSSILLGFSLINHPFWGTPIFGNPHILATGQNDPSKEFSSTALRLEEAPFPSLRSVFSGAGWRRPVNNHWTMDLANKMKAQEKRYLEKLSCVVFVFPKDFRPNYL